MNPAKYRPFPQIELPDRTWPSQTIKNAPVWCSVDLRDGNQSLEVPMSLEQKLAYFHFLTEIGFKHIEIGFPAASETEFQFVRKLIEEDLIPADVTIQVLTQSREHIIRRTFEALAGVHKAIVHLYNNTAPLWRRVVFGKSKTETIQLAVFGAKLFNELADEYGAERFAFEYSPESFSQTEVDFSLEICNAVLDVWRNRPGNIIDIPMTVETATPNVYADQVEYMCRHLRYRKSTIICVHTHNDRGTAVAAAELGLMAGAERVEGTLFGNGERTGNVDLVTLAMNLYSQGIDPGLDLSNMDKMIAIYEKNTGLPVHPRHPYAGDLVYTAFSGSHQDAIRKALLLIKDKQVDEWEIPYLPIDPEDIGRNRDHVIRFNSQSGKGGAAFILRQYFEIEMPKRMQQHFGPIVIQASDEMSKELSPVELYELFKKTYDVNEPVQLIQYKEQQMGEDVIVEAQVTINGAYEWIHAEGNGPVDAFCVALAERIDKSFEVMDYRQHTMGKQGKKSKAISYVQIMANDKMYFGIGVSSSTSASSLRAVVSAVNQII